MAVTSGSDSIYSTVTLARDLVALPDGSTAAPYRPDSFTELIGHEVDCPGLARDRTHVLVGVDVADDGCSVRLAIRTILDVGDELTEHLTLSLDTPEARVRLVDADSGEVLHEGTHAAPLQVDDVHRLNGDPVQVVATDWPNRHPELGCVQPDPDTGEYPADVQAALVRRLPAPTVTATA